MRMRAPLLAGLTLFFCQPGNAAQLQIVRGGLDSGKLYAPCVFDGIAELCFLDTGATFSSVANREPFGSYPTTGTIRSQSAAGILKETDEITLSTLQIDSVTLKNVKVARLPPEAGWESVLGIPAISAKPFALQFGPTPTLLLDAPAPANISAGLEVYAKGIFSIPLRIGNSQEKALWDTGAGLTSVDIGYVNAHPSEFIFVSDITNATDATGNRVAMKLYQAKKLVVGKRVFAQENVVAFPFSVVHEHIAQDIALIVGFNLIVKAHWYFDLSRKQWAVE